MNAGVGRPARPPVGTERAGADFPPLEVSDAHDSLLRTLGAFRLERALAGSGIRALESLRGAAAFLVSGIGAVAGPEEARYPVDSAEREATAFEHAFLRMELERFSGEIRELEEALGAGSAPAERSARRRLLRRVHRLEVLLELHAGATTERERVIATEPPGGPGPGTGPDATGGGAP